MVTITEDEINWLHFSTEDGRIFPLRRFFKETNMKFLPILATGSPYNGRAFIFYHITTSINESFNKYHTEVTRFSVSFINDIKIKDCIVEKCKTYNLADAILKHNEFIKIYF